MPDSTRFIVNKEGTHDTRDGRVYDWSRFSAGHLADKLNTYEAEILEHQKLIDDLRAQLNHQQANVTTMKGRADNLEEVNNTLLQDNRTLMRILDKLTR
jgi:hypothetical protein